MKVVVSVDYEGDHLNDGNIESFQVFRDKMPDVPIVHFLNPSYFLGSAQDKKAADKIKSLICEGDELGLHIHGHRKLIVQSGVEFNNKSTSYFLAPGYQFKIDNPETEGWDVALEFSYEREDLLKVLSTGRDVLERNGFQIGKSFRAGGWMAGPNVLWAAAKTGFKVDSSAVSQSWIDEFIESNPDSPFLDNCRALSVYVGALWPEITKQTKPYALRLDDMVIAEMPNTGCLADYVTADQMYKHISDSGLRYVHIGFHQESAALFVERVFQAISQAKEAEINMEFVTLYNAAMSAANEEAW